MPKNNNTYTKNKNKIKLISTDNDHYVKLRDEYKYDYLLITTNKTKIDIFNELNKIIL